MSKKDHVPIRTCIGCRKKKKKGEMVWFTQGPEGAIRVNEKGFHRGRGFYLCPDLECVNSAKKKKRVTGFLERIIFHDFSEKVFSKNQENGERGGKE